METLFFAHDNEHGLFVLCQNKLNIVNNILLIYLIVSMSGQPTNRIKILDGFYSSPFVWIGPIVSFSANWLFKHRYNY